MNNADTIHPKGEITMRAEWDDGRVETRVFPNTILNKGRSALAASLANELGAEYDYFIARMIFGTGGTSGADEPKFVNAERNGLFGTTVVNKPVISVIDPSDTGQAVFVSVITRDDGNGYKLNEMALQMNNGDLYSMATFPGISKTDIMQITWSWRLSFI